MKKRAKDLNMSETYVNNILVNGLDLTYEGLRLVPSNAAVREMLRYGLMISDCKKILENGYDARKRAKGTLEKCIDKGNKTTNVVVVKSVNFTNNEEVYLITHVGRFTRR